MKFYIGSGFKNFKIVNTVSKKLINLGHIHTYNWAENINEDETREDMIKESDFEIQGIKDSDIVIIILPAGRGTHIELGMALALNKKVYLYSEGGKDFELENTVNFYEIPEIIKVTGSIDDLIETIEW